jgi:hypothetical protein
VAWHSYIPFLLYTGSWDGCIRVWDLRLPGTCSTSCLRVALDHHGGVYDLQPHPTKPMLLVSTSCDTTVRFWSCEDLVPALHASALYGVEGLGTVAELMAPGEPARFCGEAWARQLGELEAATGPMEKMVLLAEALVYSDGIKELMTVLAKRSSSVPIRDNNRIIPARAIVPTLLDQVNPEPQTPNPKPQTPSPEPRTPNPELRTPRR